MKFRVPQFIDVEDKIFGPFTFRQFLYLAGGGGLSFVVYRALPIYVAIPLMLAFVALGLGLAFYKPNGKPFLFMIEAGFNYYIGDKLYIWKKKLKKTESEQRKAIPVKANSTEDAPAKKLSESKLKDIAWSLDVLDMQNKKDN